MRRPRVPLRLVADEDERRVRIRTEVAEPGHDRAAGDHPRGREDDAGLAVGDVLSFLLAGVDVVELLGEERVFVLVEDPVSQIVPKGTRGRWWIAVVAPRSSRRGGPASRNFPVSHRLLEDEHDLL